MLTTKRYIIAQRAHKIVHSSCACPDMLRPNDVRRCFSSQPSKHRTCVCRLRYYVYCFCEIHSATVKNTPCIAFLVHCIPLYCLFHFYRALAAQSDTVFTINVRLPSCMCGVQGAPISLVPILS